MAAQLRIVLYADDTAVAESHDAELWSKLLRQLAPKDKSSEDARLMRRWRGALINPNDRELADRIVAAVAKARHVSIALLLGKRRAAPISDARHIALYLLREKAGLTFHAIGAMFMRHHSSIMHGVETVRTKMLRDGALRDEVEAIANAIELR